MVSISLLMSEILNKAENVKGKVRPIPSNIMADTSISIFNGAFF